MNNDEFDILNSYNVKSLDVLKQLSPRFVDETLHFVDENIFLFT